MSRRWTREPGAPCYAHSACEVCQRPTCDDCPDLIPDDDCCKESR